MDLNLSSKGGNSSAVNCYAPPLAKTKGFGNFADSNRMSVGTQKKNRRKSKAPLTYKQRLGEY